MGADMSQGAPMSGTACLFPPYLTTRALAQAWGTNLSTVLGYSKRADDPLPVRYIGEKKRGGIVIVAEANAWLERNSHIYQREEL